MPSSEVAAQAMSRAYPLPLSVIVAALLTSRADRAEKKTTFGLRFASASTLRKATSNIPLFNARKRESDVARDRYSVEARTVENKPSQSCRGSWSDVHTERNAEDLIVSTSGRCVHRRLPVFVVTDVNIILFESNPEPVISIASAIPAFTAPFTSLVISTDFGSPWLPGLSRSIRIVIAAGGEHRPGQQGQREKFEC